MNHPIQIFAGIATVWGVVLGMVIGRIIAYTDGQNRTSSRGSSGPHCDDPGVKD